MVLGYLPVDSIPSSISTKQIEFVWSQVVFWMRENTFFLRINSGINVESLFQNDEKIKKLRLQPLCSLKSPMVITTGDICIYPNFLESYVF